MKFLATEWEMFYTHANQQSKGECLVDQISIDSVNKLYILYESADYLVTDGVDEEGNEISSYYVSRQIFDILIQGLKANNYKQVKFN